jgi:hypothetical protein
MRVNVCSFYSRWSTSLGETTDLFMKDSALMELLKKQLTTRLLLIEEKHQIFSELAKNRFTNERLLQLEIGVLLSRMDDVEFVLPEVLYPPRPDRQERREKADIWFVTRSGQSHWMELKMRATNYGDAPHGKAMKHGVDSIIEDFERLESLPENDIKHLVFFFFPLFGDSEKHFRHHKERISRGTRGVAEAKEPDIVVELEGMDNARMEGFAMSFQ